MFRKIVGATRQPDLELSGDTGENGVARGPAVARLGSGESALLGKGNATAKRQAKKKGASQADANERLIAQNRKARHKFAVLETLECGIALVGSEVKSLRAGRVSLDEAYGRMKQGELWLVGCDIPEYDQASHFNHPPRRLRKLLVHRRELRGFAERAYEKGLTLVPLKIYFKRGLAKVLMGVCQGLKQHDKREKMRKAEAERTIQRQMMRRR